MLANALAVPASTLCQQTLRLTQLLCRRSLLSSLRKLTLSHVAFSLPALQPVATRLQELNISHSRLQGHADGFLSTGWTALTSLALRSCRAGGCTLQAPRLPALEDCHLSNIMDPGGVLQLDQLTNGCPHLSRLELHLEGSSLQAGEGEQRCCLLHLGRLASLVILHHFHHANLGCDLPPSLTHLRFTGISGHQTYFFRALLEAVKCIEDGAQLHTLHCSSAEADLQPAQWGASLHEQYRRLGGQLNGLKELEVWSSRVPLLTALSAVASSAPSLTRLVYGSRGFDSVKVPPIRSASLESIVVMEYSEVLPYSLPPPILLTLLPSCTRIREVLVHRSLPPRNGALVKISCHCCSQRRITPLDVDDGLALTVGARFLPSTPSNQGVQSCTVLYRCHAASTMQHARWLRARVTESS